MPRNLPLSLSEAVQKPIDTDTLNIIRLSVTDDGTKMRFVYGELQFEYEFAATKLTKLGKAPPAPRTFPKGNMDERTRQFLERQRQERERFQKENERKDDEKKDDVVKKDNVEKKDGTTVRGRKRGFGRRGGSDYRVFSPDRKRFVFAQKHNLYLAEAGKEAEAIQLTKDGEQDYSFAGFSGRFGGGRGQGRTTRTESKIPTADRKTRPNVTWSPDSKEFFVTRTDSRGIKELFLVNPLSEPRPTLVTYKYPMPGEDAVRRSELFYCDVAAKKMTEVKVKWPYEAYTDIHWNKTGDELRFIRRDRLQRHLEVCSLKTKSDEAKCLIAEGFDAAYLEFQNLRYVDESDEMIWWSERSGWGHFYLYSRDGKLKNAITSGAGARAGLSTSTARTGCSTSAATAASRANRSITTTSIAFASTAPT